MIKICAIHLLAITALHLAIIEPYPTLNSLRMDRLRDRLSGSRPKPPNFWATINFADQKSSSDSPVFVTGDYIVGYVKISTDQEIPFPEVKITFEGTAITTNDGTFDKPKKTRHEFLNQRYQTNGDLPLRRGPGVMEKNRTHEFPFTFRVPDKVPKSCEHTMKNRQVEQSHLLLPPSFGCAWAVGHSGQRSPDMAPEMAQIAYRIHLSVLQTCREGQNADELLHCTREIRIIPIYESSVEAAQSLSPHMEVSQSVGGRFGGRSEGQLTAKISKGLFIELQQPYWSLRRPSVVELALTFTTREDAQPPQLESIKRRLLAHTFHGLSPFHDIPNQWVKEPHSETNRKLALEEIRIATWDLRKVQWRKDLPAPGEGGSKRSTSEPPDIHERQSTGSTASSHVFTASLGIPFTLPEGTFITPTFHSCRISRIYSLELIISYRGSGWGRSTHSVTLDIPVNVKACPRYART